MKRVRISVLPCVLFLVAVFSLNLTIFAARDSGFGTGGIVTTNFPPVQSQGEKIITLPNGKILTAGRTFGSSAYGELVLAQFNPNGSPDTSFSSDGKTVLTNFERVNDVHSLERKPDGRILVGGSYSNASNQTVFFLTQFFPDGGVDTAFANNGLLFIENRKINDVEVMADGRILVAGYSDPNNSSFWVPYAARYTSGGQLDLTFANGFFSTTYSDQSRAMFNSVKVLSPDRILITGSVGGFNGAAYLVMVMVDNVGNHVGSFGTNGKVQTNFYIRNYAGEYIATVVLPNGKIYNLFNNNWIAIYSANGVLEKTKRIPDLENGVDFSVYNGKIVIKGYYPGYSNFYTLAAYNGLLKPLNYYVPDVFWYGYAIQPDGKILVTGQSSSELPNFPPVNLLVARYLSFKPVIPRTVDFDGDRKSDIGVCRATDTYPLCYILFANGSYRTIPGVSPNFNLLPEDYSGDELTDLATWQVGTFTNQHQGLFTVYQTSLQGTILPQLYNWGATGDVPVGGDYDGDGITDFTIYRQGIWYVLRSSDNTMQGASWGLASDKPVPADYDGDGQTDFGIYRPSDGLWIYLRSSDGVAGFARFGLAEDKPVPGDYDADGRADFAVYRPSNGVWYLFKSTEGFGAVQFGIASDRPVPADYDGDGRTDIAVFRSADGDWYFLNSRDGFGVVHWGLNGDKPLTTAYAAY